MDSAERKRRWVEQMRNEAGADPNSPKRKPVQVYLSDEARAVFGRMRGLAKELKCPAMSNSEIVEQLLLGLNRSRFQLEQLGFSAAEVLNRYLLLKAEVVSLRTQLELCHEEPVPAGRRSLSQVLARIETPPSREAMASLIKRANNTAEPAAVELLARDLAPLFASANRDPEFHGKLVRRIESHLERLFGLGERPRR